MCFNVRVMKQFFTILILLSAFSTGHIVYAQSTVISGRIIDDQQQPMDVATVHLLQAKDSSLVRTVLPDESGRFTITNIPQGRYIVSAVLVGYEDAFSEPMDISAGGESRELAPLILRQLNRILGEVAVSAPQRPLVERKPDMLVVNVENSTLTAGSTAMDILERSPGVTVDKDDNISLMGKQGVIIMIDGKQTYLSADQLANFLRSTDGNMIKSIELITNPSSKYDASGTAGMINIVLKKNRMSGTNGTLTLGTGYGVGHKANTSLNLNHKTGRINLFGSYSYMNNKGANVFDIFRSIMQGDDHTDFHQFTDFNRQFSNHSYRAGVDYNTSDRNVFSLQLSGWTVGVDFSNSSNTMIGRNTAVPDSTLTTSSIFDGRHSSFAVNLNDQFTIDSSGRKVVADIDLSHFSNGSLADYNNTLFWPSGEMIGEPMLSRSDMPTIIDIRVGKLDYTHPFGKNHTLETGLKYSNVSSDNDMRSENRVDGTWQDDEGRTNHFQYKEQVAAAYVAYRAKLGKWGVQAGLRSEYTVSDGNSITLDNRVRREYVDFFPTLFVSYDLSDHHQTGLSYSKRINRPNYNNLNPFEYFLDQYTYQQGNPYLTPEYTHALEATYTFKQQYHLSIGYSRTNDVIVETMNQNPETKRTWVTSDNLARQENWYANLNLPVKFTKWWNSSTNVNGFYLGFEGPLNGSFLRQGRYAWQLRSNHTFTILPTLTAEAAINYQSPLVYSVYHIAQQWSIDAGLNQSLANKKANLKFSVTDIFDTRIQGVSTRFNNLHTVVNQKNETRVFRLTFTYNFGNMKNGVRRAENQSEEKSRVSMP